MGATTVALAAVLLVGAPPVAAAAEASAAAKPKKCKKSQVAVKVGGKKRCVPINKVFPPASDVDPALAFAQSALALDLTDVRRPAPAAAKRGRKALLKAVPAAVTLLDQLRAETPPSRAARRAGCAGIPPAQTSSTTTSGGASVSASFGPGGAAFAIETELSGVTYRIRYESNVELCKLEVPRCPTAEGIVDARGDQRQRVILEGIVGGQVKLRQVTTLSRVTNVRGKVAEDALLDTIDIDDVARIDIEATGAGSVRSSVKRDLKGVNMRDQNASYFADASRAKVTISGDRAVRFFDARSFASHIGDIRREYRRAESGPFGWANFDKFEAYCPKLVWEPPSGTKTLRKFQPWRFGGRVEASSEAGGGTAAKARWEVADQANAGFSIAAANAPEVSVDVMVTNAGPQIVARATFKVRSTAGVVRERYEINTEAIPTINHIAGPFNVATSVPTLAGPSVFTYAGNVVFDRFTPAIYGGASGAYMVARGLYTVTASGIDSSGATACHQSGSEQFALTPSGGSISVQGTGPMQEAPHTYSFQINAGGPSDMLTITRFGCPSGAESQNGTTFDVPVVLQASSRDSEPSADGLAYSGMYTDSAGGASVTNSWNLTGTETPPP